MNFTDTFSYVVDGGELGLLSMSARSLVTAIVIGLVLFVANVVFGAKDELGERETPIWVSAGWVLLIPVIFSAIGAVMLIMGLHPAQSPMWYSTLTEAASKHYGLPVSLPSTDADITMPDGNAPVYLGDALCSMRASSELQGQWLWPDEPVSTKRSVTVEVACAENPMQP